MTESLATNDNALREFQDRLAEKLRADIGALLPDAVLQQLVEKAVEEQFFKPRKVLSPDRYSTTYIDAPSWFIEEVAKIAEPVLRQCVQKFVEENREVLEKGIKDFLASQNLLLLAMAQMRTSTIQDMFDVANNIVTRIKQGY